MERSEISMLHVRMRRTGGERVRERQELYKVGDSVAQIVLDLMHLDKAIAINAPPYHTLHLRTARLRPPLIFLLTCIRDKRRANSLTTTGSRD